MCASFVESQPCQSAFSRAKFHDIALATLLLLGEEDKQILLVTQKDASHDDPSTDDIYTLGTIGTILQLLKLPDGTVKVLVEGGARAHIRGYTARAEFFEAEAEIVVEDDSAAEAEEIDAMARAAVSQFEQYIKLNKKIPPEVLVLLPVCLTLHLLTFLMAQW